MSTTRPLELRQRVALWDGALSRIRAYLRAEGLLEVSTRVRVEAPAIEPFIEVLRSEGRYLATSPEIEMKQLLADGAGSIFQIAHVFRAGEVGARHREEFHLVEWYRVGEGEQAWAAIRDDVEAIVGIVGDFVRELLGRDQPRIESWVTRSFDDLWAETVGAPMPVSTLQLRESFAAVSGGQVVALDERHVWSDPAVEQLALWSELFSWWSDRYLDDWLAAPQLVGQGLHLVDFPEALAALSQLQTRQDGRARAMRFESYAAGAELANGYLELRDAAEQRVRFERVNALRAQQGQSELPISAPFCEAVGRLPECAGVALGLERLLCASLGVEALAEILPSEAP